MNSADRDQWLEIAQAIRAQLAQQVLLMPAMKPDEIKTLIDAAREAYLLEVDAATFDEAVEGTRKWLERRTAYGE